MLHQEADFETRAAPVLAGNSVAAVAGQISATDAADYIAATIRSLELLAAAKNLPALQAALADCRRQAKQLC